MSKSNKVESFDEIALILSWLRRNGIYTVLKNWVKCRLFDYQTAARCQMFTDRARRKLTA